MTKLQSPDNKISFDRWLIAAKDTLKWNDYCIQLFWEMLCLANSYLQSTSQRKITSGESIDFEYLSIFLILHTSEGSGRPQSPGAAYDDIWPIVYNHLDDSPIASPTKGNSSSSSLHIKIPSVVTTPKSPSSPQSRPTSPKRSHVSSPRQARTASQYLHILRQKLPIILYALSLHDTSVRETISNFDTPYDFIHSVPADFSLSRRAVDCLGLILCGGFSREEPVTCISMLNPFLNTDGDPGSRVSKSIEMIDINNRQISFSDLSPWLEAHMCVNEIYYPNISSPSLIAPRNKPHATMLFGQDDGARIEKSRPSPVQDQSNIEVQEPIRLSIPLSSLCRSKPTVMTGMSTTVMHTVTSGPTRTNKSIKRDRAIIKRSSNSNTSLSDYNESSDNAMSVGSNSASDTQGANMNYNSVDSNVEDMGIDSGDEVHDDIDNSDFNPGLTATNNTSSWLDNGLPQLIISNCSKSTMYMLSPYSSVSISGCHDSEIVIGAVSGAVTITGCERLRITCACNKLIIQNCLECEFYIATLSRTVILGDSRSLIIAPFNATYKDLDSHLRIAGIEALCHEEKDTSITSFNNWSQMCDVNICLEAVITAGSPSGYAIDATDSSISLPAPHFSTASIISQEKFMFVNIPNRSIYQSPEMCPIPLPKPFQIELAKTNKKIDDFYHNIKLLYPENRLGVANTLVSKKFLDWMARSGKAQQLLELIKLDADNSNTNQKI